MSEIGARRAGIARARSLVAPLLAGLLLACSLPPLSLWPLAPLGLGLLFDCLREQRARARAWRGGLAGLLQFGCGLYFIAQFTLAGYIAAIVIESLAIALACACVPRARGRGLGFVAAMTLFEALRVRFPFGGLPLSALALGQATSLFGRLAAFFGPLTILTAMAIVGVLLAKITRALVVQRSARAGAASGAIGALVIAALVLGGNLALASPGAGRIEIAAVQGGGPRGLSQLEAPPADATLRNLAESDKVPRRAKLVVWPEDTVPLETSSPARDGAASIVANLARRLGKYLVVGATERVGASRFLNEAIEFSPTGQILAHVEKVHPVPFGEYVPERGLFQHVVNLDEVPLDAIPGHSPEIISAAGVRFGLLISYEAFFPELARADVNAGAKAILLPTNTASYRTDQVPAEELAAARLDAIATGRGLVIDATTGYSAFIAANGSVTERTDLGKAEVISAAMSLSDSRTIYDRVGSMGLEIGALVALVLARLFARVFAQRVSSVVNDSSSA